MPLKKINIKWIKDLNVRLETVKLLEENIGEKLRDLGLGNDFLDMTIKPKIIKWGYVKLKTFCTAKEMIHKMKGNIWNGRKYLQIIYLIRVSIQNI